MRQELPVLTSVNLKTKLVPPTQSFKKSKGSCTLSMQGQKRSRHLGPGLLQWIREEELGHRREQGKCIGRRRKRRMV